MQYIVTLVKKIQIFIVKIALKRTSKWRGYPVFFSSKICMTRRSIFYLFFHFIQMSAEQMVGNSSFGFTLYIIYKDLIYYVVELLCGVLRVEIVYCRRIIIIMKLKVLNFVVFTLTYADAQLLLLQPISEAILSENSYECSCDFIYDEYDPVCGSNGLTYSNPSYLYCDQKCKDPNLSAFRKGACSEDATKLLASTNDSWTPYERMKNFNRCNCPKSLEYNPVCGTNGITYDNPAQLQCEKKCRQPQLNIARYGLCREEEYFKDPLPFFTDAIKRCDCIYRNERDLVCATDGYTYPNPSTVSCVTRCNNPSLRIVHYGRCRENQKPHNYGAVKCKCTPSSEHYQPICADNGITYDNLSLLYCARECLNRNLKIVSEYPCRSYLNVDERKI